MTLTGGPYFPPGGPPPANDWEVFSLAGNRNGGYTPYTNNAFQRSGVVYFGWVDGFGNIEAATYDEATETTSLQQTIHASFDTDAHSAPALCRRDSDGRIVVLYSKHSSTPLNIRVATNPDSVSGWGGATNLDSQLGGTRYTNFCLHEWDDTLWTVGRDEPTLGTDSRWVISSCDSSTPTSGWAAQTIVYRISSQRSYVKIGFDDVNGVLHFVATNGSGDSFSKLGHFYFDIDAGTYHKSDGTPLTIPLEFDDITEIYAGTENAFASNVVIDAGGDIVVAAQDNDGADIKIVYIRWDGASWTSTDVTTAGTGYEYNGTGTGFTAWGHCIDEGDVGLFWVLRDTGGAAQLYAYVTADGGATFDEIQVQSGSAGENTQVVAVRNPDKLRAMFQGPGTWTTYTNWNQTATGVRAI